MKIIYYVILSTILISCTIGKKSFGFRNNLTLNKDKVSPQRDTLILAYELCARSDFYACEDGYDTYYIL